MDSNDHFDGKATHLNCFYLHINFEQKYPKPGHSELSINLPEFTQFVQLMNLQNNPCKFV